MWYDISVNKTLAIFISIIWGILFSYGISAETPSATLRISPNPVVVGEALIIDICASDSEITGIDLIIDSYNGETDDSKDCGSASSCCLSFKPSNIQVGQYDVAGNVYYLENGRPKVVLTPVQTLTVSQPTGTPPPGMTPPPGTTPGIGFGQVITIPNPLNVDNFQDLLNALINFIFMLGLALAPVMFIIAGFLWLTSAGDAKRLDTAKNMMLYTVIGLVVLLFARGLVAVIKSILGV